MSSFLLDGEQIVFQGNGSHIKSFINVSQGTFYLTNKRLIFARPSKAQRIFIPEFSSVITGTDLTFAHPYSQFKSLVVEKHGFAKKYTLTWLTGEKESIQVMEVESWLRFLSEHVKMYSGGEVVQDNAGGFYVVR